MLEVTDRTVRPSARVQLARQVGNVAAQQEAPQRQHAPPRLHPSAYSAKTLEGLDTKTDKWRVGDEFEWYTNDERDGVFRVVELYPPNVVFAVFKEDMDSIWTDARAAEFDEIMNWLASEAVQNLYKTAFGPRLPITNTKNEQMVVMYNAGSDAHSTGVMIHNIDGERTTTTVHMRDNGRSKWWYHDLAAHELAHAWDRRNNAGFVGPWSTEGIATWFADENSRLATNVPLDANRDADEPLRGLRPLLPWTGDFLYGYGESHAYLRFLVTALIFDHGQSYASAARRVVTGATEDWYGHYFVQWDEWDRRGKGPGLVERMREVVPGWDPIESRLDWMVSFAPGRPGRAVRVRHPVHRQGVAALPGMGDDPRRRRPDRRRRVGRGRELLLPGRRPRGHWRQRASRSDRRRCAHRVEAGPVQVMRAACARPVTVALYLLLVGLLWSAACQPDAGPTSPLGPPASAAAETAAAAANASGADGAEMTVRVSPARCQWCFRRRGNRFVPSSSRPNCSTRPGCRSCRPLRECGGRRPDKAAFASAKPEPPAMA